MSYQRSKAPLSLMEQLIMVFVFAFAAAICLQAFVYSDRLSKDGTEKETASVRATEVIETVKAYHGDFEKAAAKLGATVDTSAGDDKHAGETLTKEYADDGVQIVVTTKAIEEEAGGDITRQSADVAAWKIPEEGAAKPESPVYTVSIAWQREEQLTK